MTLQEKRSLVHLSVNLLTMFIYGFIVFNKYQQGGFDTTNLMQFWAFRIIWYIPIFIVARIISEILQNIVEAIGNEIKGESQDDLGIVDERDKLIELKADRVSNYTFSIGFMIALVTQAMNQSVHWFFLTLIIFGLLGEVTSEILKMRYYRRGV